MKQCKTCKQNKNLESFGPHKTTKDGYANNCRPCDSKRVLKYQKDNSEKYKEAYFIRGINRHGISVDQYNKLVNKNNGSCWICGGNDQGKRLAIDHDHQCCKENYSCGKCIRGVLCQSCNMIIGHIENNKIDLNKIDQYLRT
jgi:hypothetical protein